MAGGLLPYTISSDTHALLSGVHDDTTCNYSLVGAMSKLMPLGMTLTESWAMTPASSVSGLLFAHPASRYFSVGRIGQDQVADYARRRGIKLAEAERWLRPNLAYEPR